MLYPLSNICFISVENSICDYHIKGHAHANTCTDTLNNTENKEQIPYQMSTFKTSQNAYFAVYGFQILYEISKGTFEISHKTWNPYNTKHEFYLFYFLSVLRYLWIVAS